MTSARPRQPTADTAAWRLFRYLARTALEGGREPFVRLLILLVITVAASSGLVLLLGPYPVAGLGIGTLASRAYARRTRR